MQDESQVSWGDRPVSEGATHPDQLICHATSDDAVPDLRCAPQGAVEWPTLGLVLGCYAVWALGTTLLYTLFGPLGWLAVVLATVLHASLTHEILHGHPFRCAFWNAALVVAPLSVVVPYLRFKDTHLAHHRDSRLTDPYDDPETNYLDPALWARLPVPLRAVLRINNTLAGRILLGPLLGTALFWAQDARLLARGERRVWLGWMLHLAGLVPVLAWLSWVATMPLWLWALSVYAALGVLKIRTFLEHQAHEAARGRTVIIEDRGLLALLFLNNNLHAVHHLHATVPWYRLPALYRAQKARFLQGNFGYRFGSYGAVFRRYFWRAKDPVAHPLWTRDP